MRRGFKVLIAVLIAAGWVVDYGGKAPVYPAEPVPEVYPKVNIEYKAEKLTDPFIDYKAEQAQEVSERPAELKPLPSLTVQGMVWGGSFAQAIINGKFVKIRDTIEGAKIVEINKDGVEVLYEGHIYKLNSPAKTNYGRLKDTQEGGKNEK